MHRFNEPIRTYGVGRFVVDIPAAMTFAGGYSLQGRTIDEIVWQDEKNAANTWNNHIEKISRREAPQGVSNALIEQRDINGIGTWCKTALYFNEPLDPLHGAMDLLLNTGPTGFWVKAWDKKLSAKETVYEISTEIARAYRAPQQRFGRVEVIDGRDAFYLRYGAIDLPFEYKERVDIVFRKHALGDDLRIRIMTWVVHEESRIGLLERAANSLMMKLVGDLKIEKLHSGQRVVAGMRGEELIERFTEGKRKSLSFTWMHLGKKDAAHLPQVIVDMESEDGRLDEKLALWNAVLDSMRPAGR